MPKIEMGKKYQTRDGAPARILCVDKVGDAYPVVAAVMIDRVEGLEGIRTYTADGKYSVAGHSPERDLIEFVEPVTVWFNIYGDSMSCMANGYRSKQEANECADVKCRVACIQVTYKPGDGL